MSKFSSKNYDLKSREKLQYVSDFMTKTSRKKCRTSVSVVPTRPQKLDTERLPDRFKLYTHVHVVELGVIDQIV